MKSKEYQKYLFKEKIYHYFIILMQIVVLCSFLIIWQMLADYKIINSFITSSPRNIFKTILHLYQSNQLFHHIGVTTFETIISFLIGTLLGIGIAIILWFHPILARVVDPYLTVFNSLPKVSLGPILIIWIGANTCSIILMALLISLIVTIISVYNGFLSTDYSKIKLMKSLHATKYQMLSYLILPYNYKTIISSLKINISMSFIGVIMGELLVSKSGIGYLIMYGSQVFQLDLVMAGIIILMIVSYLMYLCICLIEKILIKY